MKLPKIVKKIPTDTLGLCDSEDKVIYINMNQSDKQILITTIHEALHFVHPEFTEEKVEEDANCIGEIVWKMSYRSKKKVK